MNKETIESLIWKCFECQLTVIGDFVTFKYYDLDPIYKIQFFNYEAFEEYFEANDTFAWGIRLYDTVEEEYQLFPVYDYFDGTPADLLKNASKVVSAMAEDIMNNIR